LSAAILDRSAGHGKENRLLVPRHLAGAVSCHQEAFRENFLAVLRSPDLRERCDSGNSEKNAADGLTSDAHERDLRSVAAGWAGKIIVPATDDN
jgi:hypothetical protein